MTSTTKQAALEYLKRHWSVIPIRSHDKRPASVGWSCSTHIDSLRREGINGIARFDYCASYLKEEMP